MTKFKWNTEEGNNPLGYINFILTLIINIDFDNFRINFDFGD